MIENFKPESARREEKVVWNKWWRNANFLRLAMATRFLVGVDPVSVILIGEPGTGKTEMLRMFSDHDNHRFRWQSDMTQVGLGTALRDVHEEGLKGLVVPDLGTLTNKSKPVALRLIAWLAGAMAEGMGRTDQGGQMLDFQNAQLGLYTGITERDAHVHIDLFQSNAFMTRTVLVKHHFSRRQNATVAYLNSDGVNFFPPLPHRWPDQDVFVQWDKIYDDVIISFSELIAEQLPILYASQRSIGLFRSLLMASAMLRGAKRVGDGDVEYLEKFRSIWTDPPWMPRSSRVRHRS